MEELYVIPITLAHFSDELIHLILFHVDHTAACTSSRLQDFGEEISLMDICTFHVSSKGRLRLAQSGRHETESKRCFRVG